ncbi:putative TonB-dependent receptor [Caenibius tardaugens NBRC 16725]|uniref:Putative TonB-dependent receptor n=1 Tax=Caenibius tardaugens NBRC 16725 TaxID=1219035 RepID=U2YNL2_9SPHN|nr:TonB-dependent receptor [Caenibius tardaugens NBRC 16725]GAD50167.1 putative TonB-dependent receptor [Caenibius tardaugens NBRC 16725]
MATHGFCRIEIFRCLQFCGTALALGIAVPAFAQNTGSNTGSPAAGSTDGTGLQDIIVTAQRREQRLQDVPVAVTAFSAEALEDAHITSTVGLSGVVPNLQVLTQPSSAALPIYALRGVVAGETQSQVDNGIGLYLDNVYLGRSAASLFDIADIERVEVLRGPQGTLFGRNTTGGAINFITRTPPGEFGVRQDISYGRFNELRTRTRIDLPEFGGFHASLTYMHKEYDGWVKNLSAGVVRDYTEATEGRFGRLKAPKTLGMQNTDAFFAAVHYENGPFTADYKFDYTNFTGTQTATQVFGFRGPDDIPGSNPIGDYVQFVFSQQPALGGTNVVSTRPLREIHDPNRGTDKLKVYGHSLTLNYQLSDGLSLKNILAYRRSKVYNNGNSFDGNFLYDPYGAPGSRFSILDALSHRFQRQISNETQVTYSGDAIDFVGGFFYFQERARDYNPVPFFMSFPPEDQPVVLRPGDMFSNYKARNTAYAVYAQGTFHATDRLGLTAGVRQTWDKRRELNFRPDLLNVDSRANFKKLTWQAIADYKVTPDVMVYGKVGTGYLAGGIYNAVKFNPETLISYEAGFKGDFFNRTLRLNAAVFMADYKDLQLSYYQNGRLVYENAGKARIKGFEAEATLVPARGLTMNASLGLVDFNFKRFVTMQTGAPIDLAGKVTRQNTPKTTFSTSVSYDTVPLSSGAYFSFMLQGDYRSRLIPALSIILPVADEGLRKAITSRSQWMVRARASMVDIPVGGGKVRVSLWGENLLNQRRVAQTSDISGVLTGAYNRPRTYGVEASIAF